MWSRLWAWLAACGLVMVVMRSAEEHDVEQHQLRHNAHDFEVQTRNNLGNRVFPRHEDAEQHA